MYTYYSTVYSTVQDVIEPSLRGTAMALYFCAMYALGGHVRAARVWRGQRLLHYASAPCEAGVASKVWPAPNCNRHSSLSSRRESTRPCSCCPW